MPEQVEINIGNIAGGAMIEAFDLKLIEVLKNISDVNTSIKQKRKLRLEVVFSPREDRTQVDIQFVCEARLASLEPVTGRIFVAKDASGGFHAVSDDPRQLNIFNPPISKEAPKPLEFPVTG